MLIPLHSFYKLMSRQFYKARSVFIDIDMYMIYMFIIYAAYIILYIIFRIYKERNFELVISSELFQRVSASKSASCFPYAYLLSGLVSAQSAKYFPLYFSSFNSGAKLNEYIKICIFTRDNNSRVDGPHI